MKYEQSIPCQELFGKGSKTLKTLGVLLEENGYSDVVREAQEVGELASKGMVRQVGIELLKWHDVGQLILKYQTRFPDEAASQAEKLAEISAWLCKEREFAFYGDIDFIPTERYSKDDAQRAIDDAKFIIQMAELTIK